jgi:hypothetical protein
MAYYSRHTVEVLWQIHNHQDHTKQKTQALYLASSNEIEHSLAEGGLHWLDE